jgi:hypothetical protein
MIYRGFCAKKLKLKGENKENNNNRWDMEYKTIIMMRGQRTMMENGNKT